MRILLRLFGARTVAPFVRWIYDTTAPLLEPFVGMFPTPVLEGGLVLEFSAMFALVVYAFVGYLIVEAVSELSHRASKRK